MNEQIFAKLDGWTWQSAVIGLGYVGLPLLVTQARAGITSTGFDVDPRVIERLSSGHSHVDDVADEDLAEVGTLVAFTADPAALRKSDVIFICVPTPLAVGKQPDISHVEQAARTVAGILRPGHVVILESTTYPGTTENVMLPILSSSGLQLDRDFLLAYSPERVDPGNASFRTANIPRVVGGVSGDSARAAELVYRRFVEKVFVVSNARTAEMAKLVENTFRWVNIALANELSSVARAIDVDIWETIEAAATKPFGFMPFFPGPGVGGHCIPLDPFYLQWAARQTGAGTRFIELAEWINSRMPQVVVSRIQDALNDAAKSVRRARVLVVGVSYKPNVADYRESPAIECIQLLRSAGANVVYHDPHVPSLREGDLDLVSVPLSGEELASPDVIVILTDHDDVDYASIVRARVPIVDTRSALRRRGLIGENVYPL